MDQKWNEAIFLLVAFLNVVHGGDITPPEGGLVDVPCSASASGKLLIWFRVVDHRVEFIGSFTNGIVKNFPNKQNIFNKAKMSQGNTLQLRSFKATRDSGVYVCATFGNSVLTFGEAMRLIREAPSAPVQTKAPVIARPAPTPCPCEVKTEEAAQPNVFPVPCEPLILFPLAGGCCLLLLLLIITVVHCNRIRTRRCPHHYKRQKQRKQVEGKPAMER